REPRLRSMRMSRKPIVMLLRRHTRAMIVAGTLAVLVVVATLVASDLWWRRVRVLRTANRNAQHQTRILGEYLRGSVAAADAALRQLVGHGRRGGGSRG